MQIKMAEAKIFALVLVVGPGNISMQTQKSPVQAVTGLIMPTFSRHQAGDALRASGGASQCPT